MNIPTSDGRSASAIARSLLVTLALGATLSVVLLAEPAHAGGPGSGCWLADPCDSGLSCHPGIHKCYHEPRREGEPCSAGYGCGPGLTCEAGSHRCRGPAKAGDSCHATRPCGPGLNCQPGVHRCYHVPRREGEPCSAGYGCGDGLTCAAGSQRCIANSGHGEACHATRQCGEGLSCQPGVQACYHAPRWEGEPCVAGHPCREGLQCEAGNQVCKRPAARGERCHATRQCANGLSCRVRPGAGASCDDDLSNAWIEIRSGDGRSYYGFLEAKEGDKDDPVSFDVQANGSPARLRQLELHSYERLVLFKDASKRDSYLLGVAGKRLLRGVTAAAQDASGGGAIAEIVRLIVLGTRSEAELQKIADEKERKAAKELVDAGLLSTDRGGFPRSGTKRFVIEEGKFENQGVTGAIPQTSLAVGVTGMLRFKSTGLCIDVKGGSTEPAAPIIAWQCTGSANQRWERMGNQLKSQRSGMCLDVAASGKTDGAKLVQYPCAEYERYRTGLNQSFADVPMGDNVTFNFTPEHADGMCVQAAGKNQGDEVILKRCGGLDQLDQILEFVP